MKKSFLLLIIIIVNEFVSAEKFIQINSTIQNITVFRSGAEIHQSAKTTVLQGLNEVILQNLPANINERSIQVNTSSELVILLVTYQLNYLMTKEKFPEMKKLEDSLENLNDAMSNINNQLIVFQEEETMLKDNRKIGGANTGVSTTELKNATRFIVSRISEIKNHVTFLSKKQKKLQEHITKIKNQINSYNQKINQPTGEIVLQVSSKVDINTTINFSYVVNDAGWIPFYDVRSESIKKPIQLIYKANVYQNTGMNWNDVRLTISTGNPTESGTQPILNTWWIDFYYPIMVGGAPSKLNDLNIRGSRADATEYIIEGVKMQKNASVSDYTSVTENQLAVEFQIDLPYTIPSDGKTHIVAIKEYELSATYQYYAVPKLDKDAFLLANITDWEKLNLLSGTANIFFEGGYVGQSQINTNETKDTLSFSLGRDKKINIKREKIKDFTNTKIIGENKKETYGYEISVRNAKSDLIEIELLDQIPFSQNKDIKIELEESSGATLNTENGQLKWKYKIEPTQTKTTKMIFSVKYPKEKQIPKL